MRAKPKLKYTGKRYVFPFVAGATLVAAGLVYLATLWVLGWVGVIAGPLVGFVVGLSSYHYADSRWGGWKWTDGYPR